MTEPLRWTSIPTSTPPLLLAAASASPVLVWAGRDGELFWSPTNDPIAIARIEGTPLALTLSATGDHAAWLTKGGAAWIATSGGDEARRVPGTAGYGGVTFVDGHLLCAPTETTALWIAIAAGLPEAEDVVVPRRLRLRRQVLGSSIPVGGPHPSTLLVYLRGGRLMRICRQDGAWHRTDLRPPRRERLAEGRDACLHGGRARSLARPRPGRRRPGPGATTWTLGTAGCNLRCAYCQNAALSQPVRSAEPDAVIAAARAANADAVAVATARPTPPTST